MHLKEFVKSYTIIDPRHISKLIRYANNLSYEKAGILGNDISRCTIDEKIRNVEEFPLNRKSKRMTDVKWFNFFKAKIDLGLKLYIEDLKKINYNGCYPERILNINLLKYKENYFYTKHVDHSARTTRTLSVVIFLNNDYEGGHLCFDLGQDEILKIKPEVGKTVIFPSIFLYPHYVEPVTKGTRYVVVSWVL